MCIKNYRGVFITLILITTLVGCGGGGGGENASFPGLWYINLAYVSSDCSLTPEILGLSRYPSPTYQINQDGNLIVAENLASKATFSGSTYDDGSGFIATSHSDVASCGEGSSFTNSIAFANSDSSAADAIFVAKITCVNVGIRDCEMKWVGSAEKQ